MNFKKALIVCLIPAFVISGCGKTTKEEANNTTNQETLAQVSGQGTGQDTEKTESSGTKASGDDESQDAEVSRDLFAMDTYMTLTAYGEHAQEAVDKAAERVEALDALLSTGDENITHTVPPLLRWNGRWSCMTRQKEPLILRFTR